MSPFGPGVIARFEASFALLNADPARFIAWENDLSRDSAHLSTPSILFPSKLTATGSEIRLNIDAIAPSRARRGESLATPAAAPTATASTAAIFGTTCVITSPAASGTPILTDSSIIPCFSE